MSFRISNLFFKPYLYFYLKKHHNQLQKIEKLKKTPKTFLVISNTALGDAILSTPAIKSLKKSFPDSKIIALIHKKYLPLFKNFEYIDILVPYYGGYKKIFKTIKEIKKYNPKMAMIFHGNGPQDVQIAIYCGCNYILKHPNKSEFKKYLSYDFKKERKHIIEERVDLVRKIGGRNIDLTMQITSLKNKKIKDKYKKYRNFIGFQIGASEQYRMWPIENFINLAKKLLEHREKILIIGIKNESLFAQQIVDKMGDNILNLCGKTPIEELPYLIKNLKFVLTGDTGTLHLSIALKVPTISLFSPSNPQYNGPYQDLEIHRVIKKNGEFINNKPRKKRSQDAMKLISVDDVYNKYKALKRKIL